MVSKPNNNQLSTMPNSLVTDIFNVIETARTQVKQVVNRAMVQAYWQIGQLIIEVEQQGKTRAAYGKTQLKSLSDKLGSEFGKGFDVTNLRNMRRFHLAFPIRETVSLELSWSHYNALARIENSNYMPQQPSEEYLTIALKKARSTANIATKQAEADSE